MYLLLKLWCLLLLGSLPLVGCSSSASTAGGFGGSGGEGGTAGAGGIAGMGGTAGVGGVAGIGGTGGVGVPTVIELDPAFGVEGISIFSILDSVSTSDVANAVAVMPDDSIVIVGRASASISGPTHGFLALLDDGGALHTSFGDEGSGVVLASYEDTTHFTAVTLDGEGRILIGGWTKRIDGSAFALARYLPNGSPDDSFGDDPILAGVTRLSEPCSVQPSDMAVQSNGAVVATGSACPYPQRFAAVRVLSDGTPDAAFGENGMLIMERGFSDEVLLASDSTGDRRILIGGSVGETDFDGSLDFALVGVADDGSVDEAFGDGGMVVTDFGDGSPGRTEILTALALTPSGSLLAGGSIQLLPNFQRPWQYSYDFLVAAYDAGGSLDESFGDAGSVLIDFGSDTDELVEVLPRPNGNIVVVGGSLPLQWERRIAIAHLGPDGAPVDSEYKTLTALEGAGINPRGATLDNHGRLLVTGFVRYEDGGFDAVVARYVFDPTR